MKILFLDIETAPHVAHVWGLWQQNIGLPQILDAGYVLCWAAKWLGEEHTYFDSIHRNTSQGMMENIHDLLDKADVVIHWNGKKFDIPTLNKEFLLHDLPPPAPYKQLDLLQTARSVFRFPSNKLDYISQALAIGEKKRHAGHELWIQCMEGKKKAWKEMEEYNVHDVYLLEGTYHKFLPWIKNHPNVGLYTQREHSCPTCGSTHYQSRGYAYTKAGRYHRFQCTSCGSWFRDSKSNNNLKINQRFTHV